MFKIGTTVKLIRHDQYSALVGLQGEVIHVGIESSPPDEDRRGRVLAAGTDVAPSAKAAESVYRVHSGVRTLYDIRESWLRPS